MMEDKLSSKLNQPELDEEDAILEEEGDWIRTGEMVAVETQPGHWKRAEILKVLESVDQGLKVELFLIDYGQKLPSRISVKRTHYISDPEVRATEPMAYLFKLFGNQLIILGNVNFHSS